MSNDAEETGLSLIFGIVGILIAFTALLIAYLQLRRMRTERIQVVYELA
jgi:protein-S-isoprenylcysteine O-methyltransferase Ste14